MINDNIKRYYVLCGLKTQKEELKRNYEGRNHKKEFNNWLWILTVLSYYVLCELKNTEDFKHERRIEKENMKEGIIKRISICECDKWQH